MSAADSSDRTTRLAKFRWPMPVAAVVAVAACSSLALALLAAGYWYGQRDSQPALSPLLAATAASSDTLAVATGAISSDSEGIFFLDFITGDLQCFVFYPRWQRFGAHYRTNVQGPLGGGAKNPQYLLVTGQAVRSSSTPGPQPGASLVYVTDVNNGTFAAYAVPWDRSAEPANRNQIGALLLVGSGQVRNYQLPDPAQAKPAAIVDPDQK